SATMNFNAELDQSYMQAVSQLSNNHELKQALSLNSAMHVMFIFVSPVLFCLGCGLFSYIAAYFDPDDQAPPKATASGETSGGGACQDQPVLQPLRSRATPREQLGQDRASECD
ncbi:unnamed protein product, partial [Polarella glacialis]